MAILVDTAGIPHRGRIWYHLVSDTDIEELHRFARRLGLKREWFQTDGDLPHYDIVETKRALAVKLGARSVAPREVLQAAKVLAKELVPVYT
jgi:hypothetical protein